jgi:AraC-like DNA-binding protein
MKLNINSHCDKIFLLEQNDKFTIYKLKLSNGEGTVTIFPIFSGINLIKLDINAKSYRPDMIIQGNVIEINYCFKGRFECQMEDGCLQYVGEGDLFLKHPDNDWTNIELPLGYYQGLVIAIDLDKASVKWDSVIDGMPKNICESLNRYFVNDKCFMIQSKEQTEHIFSDMYSVSEKVREVFYKIKTMEILLYLYCFDPATENQVRIYARQQVDIVKQIYKHITEEFSSRFTIESLSRDYCISATALKKNFKDLYGKPLATFMKEYRIKKASDMLCATSKSISEISCLVGYESQSKFTVAFKDIMNLTPLEYRQAHFKN